ncbi:hypothetical protein [Pseudoxanthomonas sp. z9]|uniref:hypothetical protein n=1 Tax=Pseudoxanthomonas sp. z9 TaxID=2584942 RepID=UPI001144EB86|nr:hypothetical protein [Pseudoxanthomonas sp. z9]
MTEPNFRFYSDHNWDAVDHKVAEAEFFLARLFKSSAFEFNCYLSAYLSASRSVTFAIQRFLHIPGFSDWYEQHRSNLKENSLAKTFLDLRNDHVHGGMYPVSGIRSDRERSVKFWKDTESGLEIDDLASMAREHFLCLLEIVYDAYVDFGKYIDPQQYYTHETFSSEGRGIDDAEVEVHGWICEHLINEEYSEEDRWRELRSNLDECQINYLFYSYLGKPTPLPKLPDYLQEIEPTAEDRGWTHIPAGFASMEDYWSTYPSRKPDRFLNFLLSDSFES